LKKKGLGDSEEIEKGVHMGQGGAISYLGRDEGEKMLNEKEKRKKRQIH